VELLDVKEGNVPSFVTVKPDVAVGLPGGLVVADFLGLTEVAAVPVEERSVSLQPLPLLGGGGLCAGLRLGGEGLLQNVPIMIGRDVAISPVLSSTARAIGSAINKLSDVE
jgi:hypothetical protein